MTDDANSSERSWGPLRWGAATDIGKVRRENEDAFVAEPEVGLFLVIDGMGGHRGGRVAAEMVALDLPPVIELAIHRLQSANPPSIKRTIKKVVTAQNRHVHREGDTESGYVGMGATLVMALFRGGRIYVANVGDSRAYRWRHGRLRQLSTDHSVVSELLETGDITPEEADTHGSLGAVTQYMGMPDEVDPAVCSRALRPGDRFLLCTDGVTDLVDEERIRKILASQADPQAAADGLVAAANESGGTDNTTAIVMHWM